MIDLHRCDRGAEIAEMALLLPLLCFICFGVIEVSSFVRVHQVINNAAREGARLSSLPENQPNSQNDPVPGIKSAVVAYAQQNGLSGFSAGNVTIDQNKVITTSAGVNMNASQVTVNYPYNWLFVPGIQTMTYSTLPSTITLTATAEFRNFY
jgi:Flp pilus assembly protein TadG